MPKITILVAILLCFCVALPAQDYKNQVIDGLFSSGNIISNPYSYVEVGKIDNNQSELATTDSLSKIASQFQFIENSASADFELTMTISNSSYSLKCEDGKIFDTSFGVQNQIYEGGFSDGDVITMALEDSQIFIQLNADLLKSYDAGLQESTIHSTLLIHNSIDLKGKYILTDDFISPKIKINFVEDEYWVNEGAIAQLNVELTSENNSGSDIDISIRFDAGQSPHFDIFDNNEFTTSIVNGSQGPNIITIPSEVANQLKDDNLQYQLIISSVNQDIVEIGEKSSAILHIIDDYVPPVTTLNPGDLMFVGFDNEINNAGDDRLIITNLTQIEPNTSFQLISGSYIKGQNIWVNNYDPNSGIIPAQRITYTGSTSLDVNTILCMDVPAIGMDSALLVHNILIDGNPSTDFTIQNVSVDQNPSVNIPSQGDGITLMLVQGEWDYQNTYSNFYGKILSGMQIGSSWINNGDPSVGESNIPTDIECFETQGPVNPGSYWAYFQCETPYNSITEIDLRDQLSNYSNWSSGIGTDDIDFDVDLCNSTCDIVDDYQVLTMVTPPSDVTIECDGTLDPGSLIADWLLSYANLQVTGGCYPITITNNFNTIDPNTCSSTTITFTITDGCSTQLTASANLIIEDNTAPVFVNIPSNITVNCDAVPTAPGNITAIDGCDDNVSISMTETGNPASPNGSYFLYRTWTATDQCGNQSTDNQRIRIYNNGNPPNIISSQTSVCGIGSGNIITFDTDSPGSEFDWNFSAVGNPSSANTAGPHDVFWSNYGSRTIRLDILDNYCFERTQITIDVYQNPTVALSLTDIEFCIDDPIYSLAGESPSGGEYSGAGVISGNLFDPSVAGNGIHTITYTYEDSNGCEDFATDMIEVFNLPNVSLDLTNDEFCIDDPIYSLAGESPSGGEYSGAGVISGNLFDPSVAGNGIHTITYTYEDSNGCEDFATDMIEVFNLPNVSLDLTNDEFCIDDPIYSLAGESPSGGEYSGAGVISGNLFDPSVAGNGIHTITYTYEDSNGCEDFATDMIEVFNLPNVSLDLTNDEFCIDDPIYSLAGESPSGGEYSGAGVISGNLFDPSVAGNGIHTITYTYEDSNGCEDFATDMIEVFNLPNVSLDLTNDEFCIDDPIYSLAGESPSGGEYSGAGVISGNLFDPSVAGNGIHTITYTYEDSNGCEDFATDMIEVFNLPNASLDLTNDEFCIDDPIYSLAGESPSGGEYSGAGVISGNLFDPSVAGNGIHTITYTYEDSNGCEDFATDMIEVFNLPNVSLDLTNDEFCIDDPIYSLAGESPSGGEYSGAGVISGNLFDPSVAGNGIHTITYTYEDSNGCEDFATDMIEVFNLPNVSLDLTNDEFCIDDPIYSLAGGSPSGGEYSGAGVISGNLFDPSVAGNGIHTITYTYEDSNGCEDFATDMIEVFNLPNVSLDLTNDEFCIDDPIYSLAGGSPSGGEYSGAGVISGNLFDPSVAGNGIHTITYTYEDSNGCEDFATDMIEVFNLPNVSLALTNTGFCYGVNGYLTGGNPAGGIYSGPGIITILGNYFINTTLSGTGIHTITYTYEDTNDCEDFATQTIEVFDLPNVTLSLTDSIFCPDDPIVDLSGGVPSGGTYLGNGVTNNQFDPSSAGVGIHPIDYEYIDTNGCFGTATDTITVHPEPNVTLILTQDEFCSNDPIYNLAGGSPSGGTYFGNPSSNVVNNQFDPSSAGVGIHPIYYSYTDINGCFGNATDTITVHSNPSVSMSSPSNPSLQACDGVTVTTLAAASGGLTPYSYLWNTGQTSNSIDNVLNGTTTYTVTVTDDNGCTSSNSITITALPNPVADILDPIDGQVFCAEESFTLEANTISNPASTGAYTWNIEGDPNTYTGQVITDVVLSTLGFYDITLTVTNNSGCTDQEIIEIEVIDDEIAAIQSGTTNIVAVQDAAYGSNGTYFASSSQTPLHYIANTSSYSLFLDGVSSVLGDLDYENGASCVWDTQTDAIDTSPFCSRFNKVGIESTPSGEILLLSYCVSITNTSDNSYSIGFSTDFEGELYFDDDLIVTLESNDPNSAHSDRIPESWWVCTLGYLPTGSYLVTMKIDQTSALVPSGFEIYDRHAGALADLSTEAEIDARVVASSNDMTLSSYSNISFNADGGYECPDDYVPDYDDCTPICTCDIGASSFWDPPSNDTSIRNFTHEEDTVVRVYPNPATHLLNVEILSKSGEEANLQMMNMAGQKILSQKIVTKVGWNDTSVEVHNLHSGIYLLRLEIDGEIHLEKVSIIN